MTRTAPDPDPAAVDVHVTDTHLRVDLADGREVAVPLASYPRLAAGTRAQRAHWRFIGQGDGIHWPEIDEDISIEGLLRRAGAAQPNAVA